MQMIRSGIAAGVMLIVATTLPVTALAGEPPRISNVRIDTPFQHVHPGNEVTVTLDSGHSTNSRSGSADQITAPQALQKVLLLKRSTSRDAFSPEKSSCTVWQFVHTNSPDRSGSRRSCSRE